MMSKTKAELQAPYSVKAHDVQMRRRTSRYGKAKGTFMVNPGYFHSRRGANGRFVKAA